MQNVLEKCVCFTWALTTANVIDVLWPFLCILIVIGDLFTQSTQYNLFIFDNGKKIRHAPVTPKWWHQNLFNETVAIICFGWHCAPVANRLRRVYRRFLPSLRIPRATKNRSVCIELNHKIDESIMNVTVETTDWCEGTT